MFSLWIRSTHTQHTHTPHTLAQFLGYISLGERELPYSRSYDKESGDGGVKQSLCPETFSADFWREEKHIWETIQIENELTCKLNNAAEHEILSSKLCGKSVKEREECVCVCGHGQDCLIIWHGHRAPLEHLWRCSASVWASSRDLRFFTKIFVNDKTVLRLHYSCCVVSRW